MPELSSSHLLPQGRGQGLLTPSQIESVLCALASVGALPKGALMAGVYRELRPQLQALTPPLFAHMAQHLATMGAQVRAKYFVCEGGAVRGGGT
jgi:hypothetical protein